MKTIEYKDKDCRYTYNEKNQHHSYDDRPAVEFTSGSYKGYKCWFKDGKLHRTNGPARIWGDTGRKEYWVDDKPVYPIVTNRLFFRKKEVWFIKKEKPKLSKLKKILNFFRKIIFLRKNKIL